MPATSKSVLLPFLCLQPYPLLTKHRQPIQKLETTPEDKKPAKNPAAAPIPASMPATVTDYHHNIMGSDSTSTTPPIDQVKKLLTMAELIPVTESTVVDVCTLQEAFTNALAKCTSPTLYEEDVGHSSLIKLVINYEAHTGASTALPVWPPTPPALGTALNSLQLRLLKARQKHLLYAHALIMKSNGSYRTSSTNLMMCTYHLCPCPNFVPTDAPSTLAKYSHCY